MDELAAERIRRTQHEFARRILERRRRVARSGRSEEEQRAVDLALADRHVLQRAAKRRGQVQRWYVQTHVPHPVRLTRPMSSTLPRPRVPSSRTRRPRLARRGVAVRRGPPGRTEPPDEPEPPLTPLQRAQALLGEARDVAVLDGRRTYLAFLEIVASFASTEFARLADWDEAR